MSDGRERAGSVVDALLRLLVKEMQLVHDRTQADAAMELRPLAGVLEDDDLLAHAHVDEVGVAQRLHAVHHAVDGRLALVGKHQVGGAHAEDQFAACIALHAGAQRLGTGKANWSLAKTRPFSVRLTVQSKVLIFGVPRKMAANRSQG